MEIFVTEAQMGSVAGFVKGYVLIDGDKFRFKGVAFGRYGGHNVVVSFLPAAVRHLKEKGTDPEELALEVQQNVVQGNFTPVKGAMHSDDPVIGPP